MLFLPSMCGALLLQAHRLEAREWNIVHHDIEAVVRAMRLVWERMKIVVEPSGAKASRPSVASACTAPTIG